MNDLIEPQASLCSFGVDRGKIGVKNRLKEMPNPMTGAVDIEDKQDWENGSVNFIGGELHRYSKAGSGVDKETLDTLKQSRWIVLATVVSAH